MVLSAHECRKTGCTTMGSARTAKDRLIITMELGEIGPGVGGSERGGRVGPLGEYYGLPFSGVEI